MLAEICRDIAARLPRRCQLRPAPLAPAVEARFIERYATLAEQEVPPRIVYHGTPPQNLDAIRQKGLVLPQKLHPEGWYTDAIWTAMHPRTSLGYCSAGHVMFGCAVLDDGPPIPTAPEGTEAPGARTHECAPAPAPTHPAAGPPHGRHYSPPAARRRRRGQLRRPRAGRGAHLPLCGDCVEQRCGGGRLSKRPKDSPAQREHTERRPRPADPVHRPAQCGHLVHPQGGPQGRPPPGPPVAGCGTPPTAERQG
eukprot:EG_transcript_13301